MVKKHLKSLKSYSRKTKCPKKKNFFFYVFFQGEQDGTKIFKKNMSGRFRCTGTLVTFLYLEPISIHALGIFKGHSRIYMYIWPPIFFDFFNFFM